MVDLLNVARDIARGCQYLEENQFIHRYAQTLNTPSGCNLQINVNNSSRNSSLKKNTHIFIGIHNC
jgi:hypothetical protein